MTYLIRTALLALALVAPLAHAADLVIHVDDVKSASGQVMAALYDSAGAFLKQPVRAAQAQADKAGTTLVFHDVAPDDDGVAVFHDANGNGRMDKNLMGTPTRPIAFSNNVQGRIGPPAFDAVKLAVQTAGLDTSVTLR